MRRSALLMVLLVGCSRKPVAAPAPSETAAARQHVVLSFKLDPSQLVITEAKVAPGPPTPSGSERHAWRVELLNAQGTLLGSSELDAPNQVIGYITSPDGTTRQGSISRSQATFSVDAPLTPAATRVRILAEPATLSGGDPRRMRARTDGRVEVASLPYPNLSS